MLPNHSRTSSAASSVGSSYVSSTDSNKASSCKNSPVHSRQSSFGHSIDLTNEIIKCGNDESEKNFINLSYHTNYQTKLNDQIHEYCNQKQDTLNEHPDKMISEQSNINDFNTDERDASEPIHGTIRAQKNIQTEDFSYKTLNGDIIRSVHPPGKGSVSYKVE